MEIKSLAFSAGTFQQDQHVGHYSKFIRFGARRLVASTPTDELETTTFVNADGSTAVVVLNTGDKPQAFALSPR